MVKKVKRLMEGTGIKMPLRLLTVAVVLFSIFIVGGGIYDVLTNPPAITRWGTVWTAINPLSDQQTLSESLVSMILAGLTFAGLLVSYRSTQVAYDRRKANTMLLGGIALIVLGLAGSYYLIFLKRMLLLG